jgi:hypothetical protein
MAKDTRKVEGEDPNYRANVIKAQKEKDLGEIGSEAAGIKYKASMEEIPVVGAAPKNNTEISTDDRKLTPKPKKTEQTKGQEARSAFNLLPIARRSKTGTFTFDSPKRLAGSVRPAGYNVNEDTDTAENNIARLKKGMGIAGDEDGTLAVAHELHSRDLEIANRTKETVNEVEPGDPKHGGSIGLHGGHHHAIAKIMNILNVDESHIQNYARAAGSRIGPAVRELHDTAQRYADSHRMTPMDRKPDALWEHPDTKELHTFDHPDAPSLLRSKQPAITVERNRSTGELGINPPTHVGWSSVTVQGNKQVWRHTNRPAGLDVAEHTKATMLEEHGPSKASRTKHASIAKSITDQMGAPQGMRLVPGATRQRGRAVVVDTEVTSRPKAATRPHGSSTQPADMKYRINPVQASLDEKMYLPKPEQNNGPRGTGPFPIKASTGKVNVNTQLPMGKKDPVVVPSPPKKKPKKAKSESSQKIAAKAVAEGEKHDLKLATQGKTKEQLVAKAKAFKQSFVPPPTQFTLPGLKNFGGADRTLREGNPVVETKWKEGPLPKSVEGADNPRGKAGLLEETVEHKGLPARTLTTGRSDPRTLRLLVEAGGITTPRETTGLEDVKNAASAGLINKSPSREIELSPKSGRSKAIKEAKKALPMVQPTFPGMATSRQFSKFPGRVEETSEATKKLSNSPRPNTTLNT